MTVAISSYNLDQSINDYQMILANALTLMNKFSEQFPHKSKLELLVSHGDALCNQF